jgi:putative ABC transport system permease protein
MIRTRGRKVLRDIWTRKLRTALVSTAIFIGVFGVVTFFSAGEILVGQLEKDLQQDKLAMTISQVVNNSGEVVDPQPTLNTMRELPGIEVVEGRAVYPLYWKLPGKEKFDDAYIIAHTEPFGEGVLQPMRLIEGEYPVAGQNQIAIERTMAEDYDLGVGDEIVLRILDPQAPAGEVVEETWTIVGIIFQPYGEVGGGDFGVTPPAKSVYATYEDARHITSFTGMSAILARYHDYAMSEGGVETFESALAGETPYIPIFTYTIDPANNPSIEGTKTTNNVLISLAVVAMIVSGFLVVNVINSLIAEQKAQIGVLKSLGASTTDNFLIFVGIALLYGLIGVIPGVLAGIPAGYFMAANILAPQSNTVIDEFVLKPFPIVMGIVLGLAVPFFAALIPVLNGTRVTILDALYDIGIKSNYGRGPIARLIGMIPMPITMRQALNNVNQKKFRLALTGITLTLAAGAFMGIYSVFDSLIDIVDASFNTFGAHASFTPTEAQDFDEVKALLENVDGIAAIEPGSGLAIDIEGYTPEATNAGPPGLIAVGYNTQNPDLMNFDLREGRAWNDDPNRRGIVISSGLAQKLHKGNGDEIVVRAGGNRTELEIIGVVTYPFDAAWFEWHTLAELGGLVDENGNVYANSISIILDKDDPSPREVDDVLDDVNVVLLDNGISATYTNWVQLNEDINQLVNMFGYILQAAAALIALVGAVGLFTSLSMSVFERLKEIGVMRSVGASSFAVTFQFLVEGLIIGITAWLIGIPISLALNKGLVYALNFQDLFDVTYPYAKTLSLGLAGMLLIAGAASFWPSFSASRRTVSDILRYQ